MNLTEQQASEMERKMRAEIASGSGEHAQQVGVCDRWLREHGSDPLVKLWPDPVKVDISVRPIKAPKPRMNKTETRFAQWLELQKRAGAVLEWEFQPLTFTLGDDCRFTPDFVVRYPGVIKLKCIDTKGSKRKRSDGSITYWAEEDAKVKIRVAAAKFRKLLDWDWSIYHPLPNGEWQEVAF